MGFSIPLMLYTTVFEGNSEVGAYAVLTNNYCLLGRSKSRVFYSTFQEILNVPIVECLINTIPTIGSLCQGNKHGLLVPHNTTDQELQHIRNSLPEEIKIKRLSERYNALGNVILSNDRIALAHPDLSEESIEDISNVLCVEVIKQSIGREPLVGTFAAINNVGMLIQPNVDENELQELSKLLEVQIIAGTVNRGGVAIGGGLVVNDWVGFVGNDSTVHERSVIEKVFKLISNSDDEVHKKALIETHIN
ncbi:hypothetical protein EDEG_03370 [Edhazardia aedis USNM 41457]|uniref:Eukaryotic translation initiation factor 6 n=1 Tax=Edhazardia aedis (strain USNM 41457) TaxID=1003232 RepID=J9D3Q7_EDHAE|nr:hypothetical protein EDEG_03370 [Edhazardia aedis USNM 41457]|eukprot:EJW02174.1 hypothetical protein EDEG_03370 [Edhazardia aedis USNM 41457]